MDVLTTTQRHKAMTAIRSTDTSIEVTLRKALWHKGFRYRKNYGLLPGKPDIAITKYHIAIFLRFRVLPRQGLGETKTPITKRK